MNVNRLVSSVEQTAPAMQLSTRARGHDLENIRYRAVWRSGCLVILPIDCHPFRQSVSAVIEGDADRLLACLQRSSVKRILLSSKFSSSECLFWAELGQHAKVDVFVQSPLKVRTRLSGKVLDFIVNACGAAALLVALSPLLLGISVWLVSQNRSIISRKWSTNNAGKFVQLYFFDSCDGRLTFGLRRLPSLANVLLGQHPFLELFQRAPEPIKETNEGVSA